MRIDRLTLTNFRGIEELSVELDPRVTLFIGPNGAGKTSILAALRIALAPWAAVFDPDAAAATSLDPDDIHRVFPRGEPERMLPLSIRAIGSANTPFTVTATSADGDALSFTGDLQERARTARGAVADVSSAATTRLPLIAVIGATVGVRRDPPDEDERWLGSRTSVYRYALDGGLRLPALLRWMKWREDSLTQALGERLTTLGEEAADKLLAGDYPDFATAVRAITGVERPADLSAISAAACAVLPGARSVSYHIGSRAVRVAFDDGAVLPLDQLSDGQRRLVGLAMRLAWMAVRLNPQDGATAPSEVSGVVLLDEVELHLHPRWQREILPRLTAAFPKLQFVATTHSPQVVSTAKAEWMRLIGSGGARRVGPVYGRDSNSLLRQAFNTPERPGWMNQRLTDLEAAIESGHLDEARALLAAVRADLGPDDTTVLGLEWELLDAEEHGATD